MDTPELHIRDCKHGSLARSCDRCELEADNAKLRARNEVLTQANTEMAPQLLDARCTLEKAEQLGDLMREEFNHQAAVIFTLRAKLARAEAVCEAVLNVDPKSAHVEKALAAWVEGK